MKLFWIIAAVLASYLVVFVLGTYFGMEWLMPVYAVVSVLIYLYLRTRGRK